MKKSSADDVIKLAISSAVVTKKFSIGWKISISTCIPRLSKKLPCDWLERSWKLDIVNVNLRYQRIYRASEPSVDEAVLMQGRRVQGCRDAARAEDC